MKRALVTMGMAALAFGMLGNLGFAADTKPAAKATPVAKSAKLEHMTHTGTVVSASGGKLVMTGRGGKEHTHPLAKDVKITVDGKPGTVDALKKGMSVSVTTDKGGNVTAIATMTAKPTAKSKAAKATARPVSTSPPAKAGA